MQLFRETVLSVNLRDYTPEQAEAWAASASESERWDKIFSHSLTLIAETEGEIVGFGSIDDTGHIDMLYVGKNHQHEGIASAICDRPEQFACGEITVHASITARGFFEKRGYAVIILIPNQYIQRLYIDYRLKSGVSKPAALTELVLYGFFGGCAATPLHRSGESSYRRCL